MALLDAADTVGKGEGSSLPQNDRKGERMHPITEAETAALRTVENEHREG